MHENEQLAPSQAAPALFGGVGHDVHDAPQWSTESSSTQASAHACVPGGQRHSPAWQAARVGQTVPQVPQFDGSAVRLTQEPAQL
jgi:hypothetical protein